MVTMCSNVVTCCYSNHGRSGQMYYMFGFIFLAFVILSVTCCETAILLCYFHLCSEVGGARLGCVVNVNIIIGLSMVVAFIL